MTDGADSGDRGWFAGLTAGDIDGASDAIAEGSAETPEDWPARAVEAGTVDTNAGYYAWLQAAAMQAAREAVAESEQAGDRQLVHVVRAMDDAERTANELAERVTEWGRSLDLPVDAAGDQSGQSAPTGVDYARRIATHDPASSIEEHVVSLARQVVALADDATDLRGVVERNAPDVAPNLSAMAGPVLAARLLSLAGDLESLARMPSGTVQVLGAEQALFAHLRGEAPSPKHGIIFVHEYVRNTAPDHRGSAARALAGKLTIAARVDYYAGDLRPGLQAELDERIQRIRNREGET